jgi:hypothetical protein
MSRRGRRGVELGCQRGRYTAAKEISAMEAGRHGSIIYASMAMQPTASVVKLQFNAVNPTPGDF